MMTVKELIAKLKTMPQEAIVELEIIEYCNGMTSESIDEVYETATGTVCLQSLNY